MISPALSQKSALTHALTKLIEVLDEENRVLQEHRVGLHAGFTDRKNQALRELMAALRFESLPSAIDAVKPLVQKLSATLQDNARLLKLHIAALGEVSDIIIGSLKEAESDGTYSRIFASRRS
ncbi:MAG: hypothetical protein ACKOED_13245 [Aestuariivirga sp.]|uniref:hypothetical protein n=1 Tax=Aestuariivirga sp. TaxID=2650926 RepID=UPI0038D1839F